MDSSTEIEKFTKFNEIYIKQEEVPSDQESYSDVEMKVEMKVEEEYVETTPGIKIYEDKEDNPAGMRQDLFTEPQLKQEIETSNPAIREETQPSNSPSSLVPFQKETDVSSLFRIIARGPITISRPMKQCRACGYTSMYVSHMKRHIMRKHTGEKPFSCPTCDRNFSTKDALKEHLRKHTGEKPYACAVCPYKGANNNYLRKHMRVHERRKRYLSMKANDPSLRTIQTLPVSDENEKK